MKVLFVCNNIKTAVNPYIYTLIEALKKKQNILVEHGVNKFWNNASSYDIIHFQWPEILCNWEKTLSDTNLSKIKQHILNLKKHNIKLVITCHNLCPHTIKDENIIQLYDFLYSTCDAVFHLDSYSAKLFEKKYPTIKHFIVPHHIYETLYQFNISSTEAKKRLRLPQNKICILCFGEFRNDQERNLILELQKRINKKQYIILTPSFYKIKDKTNPIKIIKDIYNILKYSYHGIKFKLKTLDNHQCELYFCSADIIMIPRINILNSGNLPMGFAAGKVVIGLSLIHI